MPVCKKVKLSRFCLLVFFAFLYSIPWVFGIVHNPMESERNALQSASCQNWKERKGSADFREETFGDLQICTCVLSKINLGKGHTCIIPASIFDFTCHIYSLYTQHLNENWALVLMCFYSRSCYLDSHIALHFGPHCSMLLVWVYLLNGFSVHVSTYHFTDNNINECAMTSRPGEVIGLNLILTETFSGGTLHSRLACKNYQEKEYCGPKNTNTTKFKFSFSEQN